MNIVSKGSEKQAWNEAISATSSTGGDSFTLVFKTWQRQETSLEKARPPQIILSTAPAEPSGMWEAGASQWKPDRHLRVWQRVKHYHVLTPDCESKSTFLKWPGLDTLSDTSGLWSTFELYGCKNNFEL